MYLPDSKTGEAMGDSSKLMNSWPSVGLLALGAVISQDTWANTLELIDNTN